MNGPPLLVGVDGGGTKTLGIIADSEGHELARHQVGASNPNVVGIEASSRSIFDLIAGCCAGAGCGIGRVGTVVIGLAGAGSKPIGAQLLGSLRALLAEKISTPPEVLIETDARIALEGAFDGGCGAIMIAGTGSIIMGKAPDGAVLVVGGWGRVLGDEGGGYFLGLEALKAVTRDFDGLAGSGSLRAILAERHGLDTRERIISAVYQENFPIPSIAPLVLEAAAANEKISLEILEKGAAGLTAQLEAFVRRLNAPGCLGLVFIGGLIDHETVYAKVIRESISRTLPIVEIRRPLFPPVQGAVIMARAASGKSTR